MSTLGVLGENQIIAAGWFWHFAELSCLVVALSCLLMRYLQRVKSAPCPVCFCCLLLAVFLRYLYRISLSCFETGLPTEQICSTRGWAEHLYCTVSSVALVCYLSFSCLKPYPINHELCECYQASQGKIWQAVPAATSLSFLQPSEVQRQLKQQELSSQGRCFALTLSS